MSYRLAPLSAVAVEVSVLASDAPFAVLRADADGGYSPLDRHGGSPVRWEYAHRAVAKRHAWRRGGLLWDAASRTAYRVTKTVN